MALECINTEVTRIIRRAKALYLKRVRLNSGPCGMCDCINLVLYDRDLYSDFDTKFIRVLIKLKFNREIAVSEFGANVNGKFWWPEEDSTKRLEYFDWLIEQYSKEV